MKKYLLIFLIAVALFSCRRKNAKPRVIYQYFQPWQVEYVQYKIGDTLSFINELDSEILHYKCTEYKKYLNVQGDTNACPADMESCNVHVNETIEATLACIESPDYNLLIYYDVSAKHLNYFLKSYNSESLSGGINKDSSCGLYSTYYPAKPDVRCIGDIIVNNKSYSSVAKIFDFAGYNTALDTLYINKPNGLIRFSSSAGDIWNRN